LALKQTEYFPEFIVCLYDSRLDKLRITFFFQVGIAKNKKKVTEKKIHILTEKIFKIYPI